MILTIIILWHELEDIYKKAYFHNFSLFQFNGFQVMHDYVCVIVPIHYCAELSLVDETFCEYCSHFILKWFQTYSFGGIALPTGELWKDAKNSNFENLRVPSIQNQGVCL